MQIEQKKNESAVPNKVSSVAGDLFLTGPYAAIVVAYAEEMLGFIILASIFVRCVVLFLCLVLSNNRDESGCLQRVLNRLKPGAGTDLAANTRTR